MTNTIKTADLPELLRFYASREAAGIANNRRDMAELMDRAADAIATQAQPAAVPSGIRAGDGNLPQMPEPFAIWRETDEDCGAWGRPKQPVYTADQMRAYALAAAPAVSAPVVREPIHQERILARVAEMRPTLAGASAANFWFLNGVRWAEGKHGIHAATPGFQAQAPVTAAAADDPDDIQHRFYEVRQDREMLAQALRAVLDNPTEEAKQHARLALGDHSHG